MGGGRMRSGVDGAVVVAVVPTGPRASHGAAGCSMHWGSTLAAEAALLEAEAALLEAWVKALCCCWKPRSFMTCWRMACIVFHTTDIWLLLFSRQATRSGRIEQG